MKSGLIILLVATIDTKFLIIVNVAKRGSKKWVNVPNIILSDSTSSPPPDGIPVTENGKSDSDDDSLPRLAS